ncbi:unnamed protein product, partial [Urochloa humidicola]
GSAGCRARAKPPAPTWAHKNILFSPSSNLSPNAEERKKSGLPPWELPTAGSAARPPLHHWCRTLPGRPPRRRHNRISCQREVDARAHAARSYLVLVPSGWGEGRRRPAAALVESSACASERRGRDPYGEKGRDEDGLPEKEGCGCAGKDEAARRPRTPAAARKERRGRRKCWAGGADGRPEVGPAAGPEAVPAEGQRSRRRRI